MKQPDETAASTMFPDCNLYHMEQRSEEWFDVRKGILSGSKVGMWMSDEKVIDLTVPQLKEELKKQDVDYKGKTKREDLIALLPSPAEYLVTKPSTISAQKTAVRSSLGELLGVGPGDVFVDPAGPAPKSASLFPIWNGIKLEPLAVDWFEQQTGKSVTPVGFAKSKLGPVGCSPDGLLMMENAGLEIKCPMPATHIGYLEEGVLPADYVAQVHFNMAVTGADKWYFLSFIGDYWMYLEDHELPENIDEIKTQFIEDSKNRMLLLEVERNELTERFSSGIERYCEAFLESKSNMQKRWISKNDQI